MDNNLKEIKSQMESASKFLELSVQRININPADNSIISLLVSTISYQQKAFNSLLEYVNKIRLNK